MMEYRTVTHLLNSQVVYGDWSTLDEHDLAEVGVSTQDDAMEAMCHSIAAVMKNTDVWTWEFRTPDGSVVIPGHNINYIEIQSRDPDDIRWP